MPFSEASNWMTDSNDVEIRILLDEAGEVVEPGDGRRRDGVNRWSSNVTWQYVGLRRSTLKCPGPGPHFGIAGIVRRAFLDRFLSNS